jgi:antitoxin component YwqK of YwqJK toxin-antitoxin module
MECIYYPSGALYARRSKERREYFYEDGAPKTVEVFNGESLLYWPNGKLKRKCTFKNGVRHGLDQMWSEKGQLLDTGTYEMGKPVGVHRRYSSEGQLIEEVIYLENGRFNLLQWDELGTLRVEAVWSDPMTYSERVWDRFQNVWIEKKGTWNGKKLIYIS